ncbi:hypothetical protein LTR10_019089 [Elasticomyces elasticus]|uniref:Transcriptional repressor Tup1 N-terminal domain-containing protein n=1 Tax=Exophiala sideris TaxID=1016849 RepID=A0ABR0JH61_9EURO|nr:hypothetical protein LTR10_019089 [Elasticomyces elasticus]KAK5033503.1 hypothetical protein LTS07_003807 [Exophiala sideris]KAK5042002.1 hypothetical protein LTR13_001808 [Exophiala sideris]KAK5064047.1 hypothetical protein LTR69_003815 [Exophiala sideris]KAK5185270.1 hypothetical protein LTR44_002259 [Eurotiomycetes sp. CCFEE 6388]
MDKVVHEANTEIQAMQKRLGDSTFELQSLQQKHDELADYYREKSRKLAQVQKLYNALKQRAQAAEMIAPAASKDVEQTLQSITSVRRPDAGFAKPALRQDSQPILRPSVPERGNRPQDAAHGMGVEQLHPQQRSGSSAVAAAQRGMPSTATLPAKLGMYTATDAGDLLMRVSYRWHFWHSFTSSRAAGSGKSCCQSISPSSYSWENSVRA